ncbi:MAG: bifunctional proline dehydrogenase/L-glutamate gamma-semialdehyde dehydrogenase PutA, partial [Gammaproteobacteria bacterium]|nr:bifunctional proline dehydrogenase/L-glutamate gamma-semialdehyde dehydrogenase PutA [Gammaproteobacteria bacterium]
FATHNAHTAAAILHMADGRDRFEFQRLHGMGEQLFRLLRAQEEIRCRIYAPVGAHRDLLAYLVRRLLENGANSSFVNQLVDQEVTPEQIAADPFDQLPAQPSTAIRSGSALFLPQRRNSRGFDLDHRPTLDGIDAARSPFRDHRWQAGPLVAARDHYRGTPLERRNPALPDDSLGSVRQADANDIEVALTAATAWEAAPEARARILQRAAELYEAHFGELFALLAREAGKSLPDAVAELREAVDFLRYYAANVTAGMPVGLFACISPWNFPLAIFSGQIAAALAAGNGVLAKPAEQTPLIAWRAVQLLHAAGVPVQVLQLLPGEGDVGATLTRDPRIGGVAFTGSTETARAIRRAMAGSLAPGAPLIAETGGLNAMIVDSTALPEQAVGAVIESAFQSAGQRCSALRCLYLQEDIAESFQRMLFGAMDQFSLGDPWLVNSDCGPLIDREALRAIVAYIAEAETEGRLLKRLPAPQAGTFLGPTVIKVAGIETLQREVFGPVLHLATFRADELAQVIERINATGYGLTFALQTRIDDRVQTVCERINAGNIYVNRNQIGAIVGSQPFGGSGLSGTGPKAGGPHYLERFQRHPAVPTGPTEAAAGAPAPGDLQALIALAGTRRSGAAISLPGPTGESNRMRMAARAPLLCLGPGAAVAAQQAELVRSLGGVAVEYGVSSPAGVLTGISGYSGVLWWGGEAHARVLEMTLAATDGPLLPLITGRPDSGHLFSERHVCVDTTASGGNTELLSGMPPAGGMR